MALFGNITPLTKDEEKKKGMLTPIIDAEHLQIKKQIKNVMYGVVKDFPQRQLFNKIESNYHSNFQLNHAIKTLEVLIKDYEIPLIGVAKADKHLIKDLRRNYNRLLNIKKQCENFQLNKDSYESNKSNEELR